MSEELKKEWEREFVEKGADLEHDRWARWQKYMFSKFEKDSLGNLIVPKEYVERWFRQIDTKYADLSEQEKESDRKETRSYLPLFQKTYEVAEKAGYEKCKADLRKVVEGDDDAVDTLEEIIADLSTSDTK
jgi:hypothetical protein